MAHALPLPLDPNTDRDFGSQYQGPVSLLGCMHDPWENTCTCTIVSFLTDFGILIIHECIPVHTLVGCIIV